MNTESVPDVKTTARHLSRVLEAAAPFAERDEDGWPAFPGLAAVRLEAAGGVLCATATDRHIAAHARGEASGSLPRPVHVSPDEACGITNALKPFVQTDNDDEDDIPASLTLESPDEPGARLVVRVHGKLVGFDRDVTVSARDTRAEFPIADITRNYAAAPTACATLTGPFAIDPRFLETLSAVRHLGGRFRPLRFYATASDAPVRVEFEDWFVALVAPVSADVRDYRQVPVGELPNVPFGLPAVEAVAR